MAFTDRFGNGVQEVAYPSINQIALTTLIPNVTLSWPIEFQNVNGVVAAILHITATANGQSVTLPPSNIASPGQTILVNNMNGGAFSVDIKNAAGVSIVTLGGGNANARILYLLDNQTKSGDIFVGTWIDLPWGGGYSAVTSVGLAPVAGTAASNLTVTGSPITTTGTFQLGVTGNLKSILELATAGFLVNGGAGVWNSRVLTPTANQIAIDNPDGVSGNPQIKLAADIRNITSLQAGNLLISGNTIANQAANSDIILTPNGTGELKSTNNFDVMNGQLLKFYNTGSTHFISFNASASMPADYNIIWPISAPSPATFLMHLTGGQTQWQPINQAGDNLLVNGSMTVWQAATNFTDTTYFKNNNGQFIVDYYRLWSDGDTVVTVSQQDGPADPNFSSPYCCRLTLTPGGAGKKFGIGQFIEYKDTQLLKGRTVSFSFAARGSVGGYNLRAAIIYFNGGSADTPVTSLIQAASWGAQGTDPVLATNWNYINARTNLPLANIYSRYTISNVTIPSVNIQNIGILIWMDNTNTNSADYVDISCVKLEYGPVVSPFECRFFSDELADSKRIFQQDLPYGIPTGTTGIANARGVHFSLSPVANTNYVSAVDFEVEMRGTPSQVVTYPYTNTALTNVWSNDTGVDFAANSATAGVVDSTGIRVRNNSGANISFGQGIVIGHYWVYAGI